MVKIDTTFPSKIIIKEVEEETLPALIQKIVEHSWQEHDTPADMRQVKSGKKLTLDLLPKNYDMEKVAKDAVRKGILKIEKIGHIPLYLFLNITKTTTGPNPGTSIVIDKYEYEKDGNNLLAVVNSALRDI